MGAEKQRTILLVEDEVITAMAEKMVLEKFGYKVILANSGEEAVAVVEKTPAIDLILMDINLGAGMDGTEAAAIIIRQRDLPVVFLSSHMEPEVVAKTEKITSYGYVVKDSSITVLDASIKMAFKLFEAKTKEKEKESQMEAGLEALSKSEARLAEAQAVAKVGSWETDLANLNVIWSEETYRIFEIDPGSVHLTQAGFLAFTHPEDCAKVDAAFLGSLDTRSLNAIEHRIITPGGLLKFIEERWRIFQDDQGRPVRAVGTCQDITERKQGESKREAALAALRLSEAKQSNALQMTKAGHWEYDVDRDLFTFNDNFYRIFRTTAAAVGGYQLSSGDYARRFCHPEDMALVGIETQGAIASPDPNYSRQIEHRILYADGTVGYIAVRFFIVKDPQGRTVKTYGVNQDITERKRAEEEVKRQLAEKEILLKEVHHRIKNNIASIGGLLALHRQAVTHPQAVAALQDAISRVGSMEVLYEKLLLTESYKDISVKKYIGSLADTIITLFPGGAKVAVDKQVADFHLDAKRLFPLGLIVNELITNKMKYAFIKRKTGRITISLAHADGHVTLSVLDNGKELPVGFDIDKSKGFGLTLVKMLCQQLGGSFAMEKRKGTRCTVEFDV